MEQSRYRQTPQSHYTARQQPPSTSDHSDRECAICISDSRFAVRTNCGHLFCASCMITYWQSRIWNGPMTCPLCRRQVIILLREFTAVEQQRPASERQAMITVINQYNARFAAESQPWLQSFRDLPTLLRRCMSEIFSMSGLAWLFRMRIILFIIAVVIYIILPVDLIPELIFGAFGLLDDLLIAIAVAVRICIEYRRQVAALAAAAGR